MILRALGWFVFALQFLTLFGIALMLLPAAWLVWVMKNSWIVADGLVGEIEPWMDNHRD